jgi:hypothetical protein
MLIQTFRSAFSATPSQRLLAGHGDAVQHHPAIVTQRTHDVSHAIGSG